MPTDVYRENDEGWKMFYVLIKNYIYMRHLAFSEPYAKPFVISKHSIAAIDMPLHMPDLDVFSWENWSDVRYLNRMTCDIADRNSIRAFSGFTHGCQR